VQKCLAAGVPIICAISAPSSLAVALAAEFGMTLVGFLRGERFNIYSGIERIDTMDVRQRENANTEDTGHTSLRLRAGKDAGRLPPKP